MTVEATETAENRFFEPWTPKIGQRVRVRLSGECQFWGHRHVFREDGAIATVERIVPLDRNHGHGYEVLFDKPWPCDPNDSDTQLIGSPYAAIELEPVDDPS